MMTFLGILLILAAVVMLVGANFINSFMPKKFQIEKIPIPKKGLIAMILVGFLLTNMFYSRPGYSYKVYYPWGGGKIVNTNGFKFDWWGTKRAYQNEIAFKYVIPIDSVGTVRDLPDNIYAFSAMEHQWEFADAVKAHIGVSIVLSINSHDEANFSKMVDDTKFEDQLVHGRIIPDINTAIKNTCKLMYAQEYISGEAANFDRYLKDQLENGSYQLEPYFEQGDDETIGDSIMTRKVSTDGTSNGKKGTKRWKIKEDPKTKIPLRDKEKTSLALYHISVKQAVSDNIDWENRFDDRLDRQKEQVAATQLEKQLAEKAVYAQKKKYAEGEANKTEKKAELEKDQIQKTIAAETAAKVAFYKVQEEQNLLDAAKKSAQRVKIESEAQAYANAKLKQAGLTPQEEMQFLNERAIGVAEKLSNITFPSVLVTGNDGKNADGLLSTLISAEFAKQMMPKK